MVHVIGAYSLVILVVFLGYRIIRAWQEKAL